MGKHTDSTDFLVIGGGVIGLNIARELKRRNPASPVLLIEKEANCGSHASSRNSGVLHAGFYYSADSLKARFTAEGNRALHEYCDEKKLPVHRCGKLVVARDEADLAGLDELSRRAKANGVTLNEVTETEAKKIEPRAKTFQRALFSPATSTVDPAQVVAAMKADAAAEGVEVQEGVRYVGRRKDRVITSKGPYNAGYVVNCAGLYADKIALDFGFSKHYRIVPFKGVYLYSDEPPHTYRTHIYPVPDLRNPFLGVHLTVTVEGKAKIGPSAIPAFWREQYQGFENFKLLEMAEITMREAGLLMFSGFDFKRLAVEEMQKYSRRVMVGMASRLIDGIDPAMFRKWGRPGIRAQLMDIRHRKLEMDFVIEGGDKSCHVLNAVSPGFTCSIPFSKYVCDKIEVFSRGTAGVLKETTI